MKKERFGRFPYLYIQSKCRVNEWSIMFGANISEITVNSSQGNQLQPLHASVRTRVRCYTPHRLFNYRYFLCNYFHSHLKLVLESIDIQMPTRSSSPLYLDSVEEPGLLTLLQNSLTLSRVAPNLPTTAIVALASTSRSFRTLAYNHHPGTTFRYVDLGITSNYIGLSNLPTPWHAAPLKGEVIDERETRFHHDHQFSSIIRIDDYWIELIPRAFHSFGLKNVLGYMTTLI